MLLSEKMRVRGLHRNGLLSLSQSFIILAYGFLTFRLLIAEAGLEGLGLWSLLMIFGGVATTFDFSGAGALARTVARSEIEFASVSRPPLIHTVLLTSLAINLVLTGVFLFLAQLLLPNMVSSEQLPLAGTLLPWVAGLMLTTPLAVGISSSIDGLMRADQRAILLSAAAVVGLLTAWFAIPKYGVVGIAVAQSVQQAIIIIGGWILLRHHIPGMGWFPVQWHLGIFRQTSGYAVKLNIIGVLSLLLEPLTKYCINLAGGVVAVGSYELASRLATQLRGIIVSATTPLIPAFAASDKPKDRNFVYRLERAQAYALIAALAVVLGSIFAAPIMCWIILGHGDENVIRMNALLSVGWGINLFALPMYYAAQGQGILRWNIASHALTGLTVLAFSLFLAPTYGSIAVVFGVATGLVLGTIMTMAGNARLFGAGKMIVDRLPLTILITGVIVGCAIASWVASYHLVTLIAKF